jgi:hypothetical protein
MSLKDDISAFESATQYFLNLAAAVKPDKLDIKHENGWSARQIIHHVADSEVQSYVRLRRLMAEPEGTTIQGYDEGAWAANPHLGYEKFDVKSSIAAYAAVRASTLDVLKTLSESDLERWGDHTETGRITVQDWLNSYVAHPKDHGDQLVRALKGQE